MIKCIKDMINKKQEFIEAASIIYEDASGNIDDLIVLGEDGDFGSDIPNDDFSNEPGEVGMEDGEKNPENNETNENNGDEESMGLDNEPTGDENETNTDDQPTDFGFDNDSVDEPAALPAEPAEHPMPLPGDDGLPNPIGAQTNEPIEPDDDLLSINIDLRSNTATDILPIPPKNAIDSLAGAEDTLSHSIDSGFGNDQTEENDTANDMMQPPVEEDQLEESAALVLDASGLKGYHLEDMPYIIYTSHCKNKGKKAVSKNEFNSSDKFRELKAAVYKSISTFIKDERLKAIKESTITIELYDKIVESSIFSPERYKDWKMIDMAYELYEANCKKSDLRSKQDFIKDPALSTEWTKKVYNNITSKRKKEIDALLNELDKPLNYKESAVDSFINNNRSFYEAISLGDDGSSDDASTPDDDSAQQQDSAPDVGLDNDQTEENDVTSAVRDKVAEADVSQDDGGDIGGTLDGDTMSAVWKKLNASQKSLDDAKQAIFDTLKAQNGTV